jgi:thioesterase domain-containing protein
MRQSEFALALNRMREGKPSVPSAGLPMVFLLPGTGGDTPVLAEFRAECATAMNIHETSYPDLDRLASGSFDDIVAHTSAQIEQIAPKGAIVLAGYSFGGDVAYAVANRLLARGRQISALLILDTIAIRVQTDGQPRKRNGWGRRFITLCRLVRNREWHVIMNVVLTPRVVGKPASLWLLRLSLMFRMPTRGNAFFYLRRHLQEQILVAYRTQWMQEAPAKQLAIPVILFRSEESSADLGWRSRAETLTIIPVKGDHLGMLNRENAAALSEEFIGAVRTILCLPNTISLRGAKDDFPPARDLGMNFDT